MKNYTLSQEESSLLFEAIEISLRGLPMSTSLTAYEASSAIQVFQKIRTIIIQQNATPESTSVEPEQTQPTKKSRTVKTNKP